MRSKSLAISFIIILNLFLLSKFAMAIEERWKITSDSSNFNLTEQTLAYSGNAKFEASDITISGDKIVARKIDDSTSDINISGDLATLIQIDQQLNRVIELTASNIYYHLSEKLIKASGNIELSQKDSLNHTFFKLTGNQVTLETLPTNQLQMNGKPLVFALQQLDQPELNATAEKLHYDQQKNQFELQGQVTLFTGRESIKANKILYNTQTQTILIPESQDQRVEMTQTKKQTNE